MGVGIFHLYSITQRKSDVLLALFIIRDINWNTPDADGVLFYSK